MEKIHQPKTIVEQNEQECHFYSIFVYFQFVKWKSSTVIFYKTFDKNGAFSILQP